MEKSANAHIDSLLREASEDGQKISPMLPEDIKNYLIDIDGTICDDIPNEEPERMATAKLYRDALDTLNNWHDEGHVITFFTSRTEDHREVTEKWLKDNGFKWHGLLMGKPRGGNYHWVDNHIVRATRYVGRHQTRNSRRPRPCAMPLRRRVLCGGRADCWLAAVDPKRRQA